MTRLFALLMLLAMACPAYCELTQRQVKILLLVAEVRELSADETALLMAIRDHEHGSPGRECGVFSPTAQYFQDGFISEIVQADGAAWIIKQFYRGSVVRFAKIYAPIGADNDPKGLNKCWAKEVSWLKSKYKRGGK